MGERRRLRHQSSEFSVESITHDQWTDEDFYGGYAFDRFKDLVLCARQSQLGNQEPTFRILQLIEQTILSRGFRVMKLVDRPVQERSQGLFSPGEYRGPSILISSAVFGFYEIFLWDFPILSFFLSNGVEWLHTIVLESLIADMWPMLDPKEPDTTYLPFRIPILECLLGSGLNLDM